MPSPAPPTPMTEERAAELAAARQAVHDRVGAELAAAQVARLLAGPAELLVPVVRALRGQRGVTLLPGAASQAGAVLAGLGVRALQGRGRFRGRRELVVGGGALLALAPLAGLTDRWVVLDHRSPLWGIAVQAALTVPVSLGIALTVVRVSRAGRDEHRRAASGS